MKSKGNQRVTTIAAFKFFRASLPLVVCSEDRWKTQCLEQNEMAAARRPEKKNRIFISLKN